ncbi:MAG: ABC-2 family transporter protein [Zavarzinella sp.]
MYFLLRYLRIWWALAKYGLIREASFRGNFLIKVVVEALWLVLLLIFYRAVFRQTSHVASWSESEYLFFIGCHYTLLAIIESLFLVNCGRFAEIIRSGEFDFYLIKPIDEQFLVSCRTVDWSTVPNMILGISLMIYGTAQTGWQVSCEAVLLFPLLMLCGVAIAYGFLLMFTSLAVWMTRNQSLFEIWWLFTTLVRYPKDIFTNTWAHSIGWFFTFLVPVMLVVNVPASSMMKTFQPAFAVYMIAAAVLLLILSRIFFRYSLKHYRSASS